MSPHAAGAEIDGRRQQGGAQAATPVIGVDDEFAGSTVHHLRVSATSAVGEDVAA